MNLFTPSAHGRGGLRLLLSFLALCVLTCTQAIVARGAVTLTLTKSNDAPNPVPSGQVFTYTLAYSWTGGTGWSSTTPGTLVITDLVPTALDVISTAPGFPVGTIAGQLVTFNLQANAPAGAGTVQINVRFTPGITCDGARACNTATIKVKGQDQTVGSNDDCVIATARNKWEFWKDWVGGCIVDSGDVVYRIAVVNPSGNDIGGLNLNTVTLTDFLPPGAIITSVTGDWTGFFPATGTVTLTGGPTSMTVSSGWGWYVAYVHVRFPGGTFSAGQTVTNKAQLQFTTPCSQGQILTMNDDATNTLCDPTPPAAGASLWKWLNTWIYFPANPWYFPSWAPGCCGTYYVEMYNSGGLVQTNIEINDTIPSAVDVGVITTHVPSGMTSATMDVFCYVGGTCQPLPAASVTYSSSGSYTPSGLPGPICHIRWRYTGTLSPGEYIFNTVDVCVRTNRFDPPFAPVLPGDVIPNKACGTGINVPAGLCWTDNSTVTATAPNILAAKFFEGKSGSCLPSCSPSISGPFYPGDVVRWRMVIANVGSATATPCTITDLLPSGFTYAGNESYYYGPISWATYNNPSCCSLTSTVPSAIGGLGSPAIGDTNLVWNFSTLPAQCNGAVDYLVIEFDAKANDNPTIPPGQYFNTYTFTAGNLGGPVVSNPAQVTINGWARMEVFKDVRPYISGTTFGPSANIQPGGQAEYRLRIQNSGILSLSNLYLLDITPHVGDISVLPPYNFRGSAFGMQVSAPVTAAAGYSYRYNTSTNTRNPTRSILFCSTIDPAIGAGPVTPGVWVPGYTPTTSFDITQATGTVIPAPGTQDFFFIATVPPGTPVGQTACNSFGVEAYPYGTPTCMKAEATPACVTVIPPQHNECDSIWGDVQLDDCCGFNLTVLNTLGNISQLQYNVLPVGGGVTPSGVVQSITTNPCLPSSTMPPSLAGTTSGTLFFTPPCGSPLGVNVHAASTTPTGEICIELIAVIVRADGTTIQCSDTVCFHCDPAPTERCDSLGVRAFPNLNQSERTFTIYNLKAPSSPICSVHVDVVPPPGGSGLHGSNLLVDGVAHAWPAGSSSNFTWITGAHGLPANSTVQFNLAVDYGLGWVGNVTITVYHCDGTTCRMEYGPWDASRGRVIDIGSSTDVPDRGTLHIHSLTFSQSVAQGEHIRSIAVHYSEPVTEIVAVTGATYPCDADNPQNPNCNDIFQGVFITDRSIMIDLRRDLDDPANGGDPLLTVVYRAPGQQNPVADITYYDENGQEVGHNQVNVTGGDPPGRIVSGLGGGDRIASMMGALTARPNPTSGRCDLGFVLPAAATVDLELIDARGNRVATVISSERMTPGEHHRLVDMSTIASGTYLVTLRVNGVPSVLRVELTK
jgi:uncharacterized repeat protein (TIGR01451 family)